MTSSVNRGLFSGDPLGSVKETLNADQILNDGISRECSGSLSEQVYDVRGRENWGWFCLCIFGCSEWLYMYLTAIHLTPGVFLSVSLSGPPVQSCAASEAKRPDNGPICGVS